MRKNQYYDKLDTNTNYDVHGGGLTNGATLYDIAIHPLRQITDINEFIYQLKYI